MTIVRITVTAAALLLTAGALLPSIALAQFPLPPEPGAAAASWHLYQATRAKVRKST